MKNPPPGKEWMGKVMPSQRKATPSGGFKFKKSAGANSSAKRFGMDEPASKRSEYTLERRNEKTRPKGRAPYPTSSFGRKRRGK